MLLRFQKIALDVLYGFRQFSPLFLIEVFLIKKSVHVTKGLSVCVSITLFYKFAKYTFVTFLFWHQLAVRVLFKDDRVSSLFSFYLCLTKLSYMKIV